MYRYHEQVEVKDELLQTALDAKFSPKQHPDLMTQLLATESATLCFQSEFDFHLGCGYDGSGDNRLGEMLEDLRQRLAVEAGVAARGRNQRRRKQRVRFQHNAGSGRSLGSAHSGALSREDSASNMERQ